MEVKTQVLQSKPTYARSGVAKGATPGVIRDGGDFGAGLIQRFAVITRGEALGHGLWIDATMQQQVADAINSAEGVGIKSRFTHPGLSSDGLGKFLGRAKAATVEGDKVLADLHVAKSAHEAPDGNLADYVMTLAETDPEAFGSSIVFMRDKATEDQFIESNGGGRFVSPDPGNKQNLRHARLKQLRAVDAVDSPAANPGGLFHRGPHFAEEAEAILSYSLGLTTEAPDTVDLEVDSDRVANFVRGFLDRHGLSLVPVAKEIQQMEVQTQESEKPADEAVEASDKPADVTPADKPAEEKPGQRFLAAFGVRGGVWFAEGLSFEAAQEKFVVELKAENDDLRGKLKTLRGEESPVSFTPAETPEQKAAAEWSDKLGPNLGKFAAGIKINK